MDTMNWSKVVELLYLGDGKKIGGKDAVKYSGPAGDQGRWAWRKT